MFVIYMYRNHGWTSFSAKAEAYNQTFATDIKEGSYVIWLQENEEIVGMSDE